MAVNFAEPNCSKDLDALDNHFASHSYVSGFNATQDDATLLSLVQAPFCSAKHPHLCRWYRHVSFFTNCERQYWPKGRGVAGDVAKKQQAEKKESDDEFDMFGEESAADVEAKQQMQQKMKAAAAKPKKVVVNKSTLVIDIKPTSLDVKLDEMERLVREIEIEGLEWSKASKQLPIAFGLYKLQIGCTIVDDLVNTDAIVDKVMCVGLNEEDSKKKIAIRDGEIECDDDDEEDIGIVQSAEIVSFNKL